MSNITTGTYVIRLYQPSQTQFILQISVAEILETAYNTFQSSFKNYMIEKPQVIKRAIVPSKIFSRLI